MNNTNKLIIITGMSGAGKTLASKILEDMNYFCVDNLPPILIPKFVELCSNVTGSNKNFVLVVDTRSKEYFDSFVEALNQIDKEGIQYNLLFMEASDDIIVRRYKESRRPHPMNSNVLVSEAIAMEREAMDRIKTKANTIIDTSNLKQAELVKRLMHLYSTNSDKKLNINVMSFGFKYGIPVDSDMVLDVRFLPNPFYVSELKHCSGSVKEVVEYIEKYPVTTEFKKYLDDLIEFLIPQYIKEGKSNLVISIGCTGGMHRSVYIANHIFDLIRKKYDSTHLIHRDLMKNEVKKHIELDKL